VDLLSRRSFRVPLLIVCVASLVFSLMLAKRRAELAVLHLRQEAALTHVRDLGMKLDDIQDERMLLLSDAFTVERVARENYGFAARGEVVVPFTPTVKVEAPKLPPVRVRPDRWGCLLGDGGFPLVIPAIVFLLSFAFLRALERISDSEQALVEDAGPAPATPT